MAGHALAALGTPWDGWGCLGMPGDTWGWLGMPWDDWGCLGMTGAHAPLFHPPPCHTSGTLCCGTLTIFNFLHSHSYTVLWLEREDHHLGFLHITFHALGPLSLCTTLMSSYFPFHSSTYSVLHSSLLCQSHFSIFFPPTLNPHCYCSTLSTQTHYLYKTPFCSTWHFYLPFHHTSSPIFSYPFLLIPYPVRAK